MAELFLFTIYTTSKIPYHIMPNRAAASKNVRLIHDIIHEPVNSVARKRFIFHRFLSLSQRSGFRAIFNLPRPRLLLNISDDTCARVSFSCVIRSVFAHAKCLPPLVFERAHDSKVESDRKMAPGLTPRAPVICWITLHLFRARLIFCQSCSRAILVCVSFFFSASGFFCEILAQL